MINKIIIVGGTAGELIKLYSLIIRFEKNNLEWLFLFTGQSPKNFINQWNEFLLPNNKLINLKKNKFDLKNSFDALIWFINFIFVDKKRIINLLGKIDHETCFLIHGDTLSTLAGAIIAKRLNVNNIAHVEAGLRSPFMMKPFPEEITRRLVSLLANIHYAPDDESEKNLLNNYFVKGRVINSCGNTLFDVVKENFETTANFNIFNKIGNSKYILVNIHRFENINSNKRWNFIINYLIKLSEDYKIIFIVHPITENNFKKLYSKDPFVFRNFIIFPRLTFLKFLTLLKKSEFLISDGGSNQEECAFINKPCLIMRDASERTNGLKDKICVISKFDIKICYEFHKNVKNFVFKDTSIYLSPSELIVKSLSS